MTERVDIHLQAHADGVKKGAAEAKGALADLKEDVVRKAAEMAGVSQDLASAVSAIAPRFLAVGAAAVVAAKAYADGVAEVKAMNLALALGGDISGQSAASLRALSAEVSAHSRLTIAEAKAVTQALAASGQVGAGAFRQVSQLAGDFARVMGTDVARVAPDLVKIFDDPAKGAEELNRRMHFLSAAELDHIEHLVRMGEVTRAQTELAGKLGSRLGEIVPPLGWVEQGWKLVKEESSKAWDAMLGIGRPKSPADLAQGALDAARARVTFLNSDAAKNMPSALRERMLLTANRDELRASDALEAEAQKSFDKSQAAEKNRRDQTARALANRLSRSARAEAIDDEIRLLEAADLRADIKAQAIARKREERDKLFEEKTVAPRRSRDLFADTVAEASGVSRDFTDRLAAVKDGLDQGRISEARYVEVVEALIMKQPFATKGLHEYMRALAEQERVLNKVDAAERAAAEVIEKAGEAHAMQAEALRLEIDLLGKSAAERARLTAFRKIDAQLMQDEAKLTDRLGQIGDLDGIDAGVAKLRAAAAAAKATWVASYSEIAAAESDWRRGARDGLQAYEDEAARVATSVGNAFKQGAKIAEDAIANFVVSGKLDIGSLLRYAATEIARQNVAKPIVAASSDWLKGLLTSLGGDAVVRSAKGNVFAAPDLHRYANTVVTQPTLFRFARGAALGEMGEAAPEAIMPLRRDGAGRLGVSVVDGGVQGGSVVHVDASIAIDARGADVDAVTRLERAFPALLARHERSVVAAVNKAVMARGRGPLA